MANELAIIKTALSVKGETFQEQLDAVDEQISNAVYGGYYISRLGIIIGQWEKGRIIAAYRGGKSRKTYSDLSEKSGRDREHLKKWHDLYEKHPDRADFVENYAKPRAAAWTKQALESSQKLALAKTDHNLLPPPPGTYRTIVIDPPWPMQKIVREVRPKQKVGLDYETMEVEEIQKLSIPADPQGCHLFLWTTHKYLPEAFVIMDSWGFDYIYTMVWHKRGGFQPYNLPQYNCEFVLLGTIGNPQFTNTKNFTCCFGGKRQGHSVKPNEFYAMLLKVTLEPRLDMFARKAHPGFATWGQEVQT